MKKYLIVAKNTWAEMLTYRLNFIMWRVRIVLGILTIYFLWLSILPKNTVFFDYNQSQMLTYILGTSLISSIVLSSRTISIGDEINQGNLSNFLIRPISYFWYWFFKDLGDKAMNIMFSVFELALLFFLLKPPLFIQADPFFLSLAFVSVLISLTMYFFLNLIMGFIGFWSPEVWGPRFIFMIVLMFFGGGLFPLDLLPKPIFDVFQLTPFPYLLYFPLKIYLGKLTFLQILNGISISIIWTFLLYFIAGKIWNMGLRSYSAAGK